MKKQENKCKQFIIYCLKYGVGLLFIVSSLFNMYSQGAQHWMLLQKETLYVFLEISVYVILYIYLGKISNKYKIEIGGLLFCFFAYSHYMLLPLFFAFFYLIQIFLLGNFLHKSILGIDNGNEKSVNLLLLGFSADIIVYALLSIVGLGSISILRIFVFISGIVLIIINLKTLKTIFTKVHRGISKQYNIALVGLIAVMIHIGRAADSTDYDSSWYGLRSPLVLDNGKGIFENFNLSGCVYLYPKGFEILSLPMASIKCYGYMYAFNILLGIAICYVIYKISVEFVNHKIACIISCLVASVPGIMNMTTTAKPDIATLLIQIIAIYNAILLFKTKNKSNLAIIFSCFILSLAFKPTAIIFSSTIVLAIFITYFVSSLNVNYKKNLTRNICMVIPNIIALLLVWGRTYIISGIPATSTYSRIWTSLGFDVNYPYSLDDSARGSNFKSISMALNFKNISLFLQRVKEFFYAPISEDMDHIIIVWGTPICAVLIISTLLLFSINIKKEVKSIWHDATKLFVVVLWLIEFGGTLAILFIGTKPDGNYFMLFYAVVYTFSSIYLWNWIGKRQIIAICIACNFLVASTTNWAWRYGFTSISLINEGYFDNELHNKNEFMKKGMGEMYDIIASNPKNRVLVFGDVEYWQLPCIAEPMLDISYWGNDKILEDRKSFLEYLKFVKCDYILVDKEYMKNNYIYYDMILAVNDNSYISEAEYNDRYILLKLNYGLEETEALDISKGIMQLEDYSITYQNGFYEDEGGWRWATNCAMLNVISQESGKAQLSFNASTCYEEMSHLQIYVNGELICNYTLNCNGITISSEIYINEGMNTVQITTDAKQCDSGEDVRSLYLIVGSLSINKLDE